MSEIKEHKPITMNNVATCKPPKGASRTMLCLALVNSIGEILMGDQGFQDLFNISTKKPYTDCLIDCFNKNEKVKIKSLLALCATQGNSQENLKTKEVQGEILDVQLNLKKITVNKKEPIYLCTISLNEPISKSAYSNNDKIICSMRNDMPLAISYISDTLQIEHHDQQLNPKFKLELIAGDSHIDSIYPIEVYEQIKPYIDKVLQGESVRFEYELKTAPGNVYFYDVYYVPRFENEKPKGFYIFSQEITYKRVIECHIEKRNRQLQINNDINQILARLNNIDDATAQICRIIVEKIPCSAAAIYIGSEGNSFKRLAAHFQKKSIASHFETFFSHSSVSTKLARLVEDKMCSIQHMYNNDNVELTFFYMGTIEKKVSMLVILSPATSDWDSDHYELFKSIANNLGFALKAFYSQDKVSKTQSLLLKNNRLLDAIQKTQSIFIDNKNSDNFYNDTLQSVIDYTGSQFGFIADVLYDSVLTNRIGKIDIAAAYNAKLYPVSSLKFNADNKDVDELCQTFINGSKNDETLGYLIAELFQETLGVIPNVSEYYCIPVRYDEGIVAFIVYINPNQHDKEYSFSELAQLVQSFGNLIIAYRNAVGREEAERILACENRAYEIITSTQSEEDMLEQMCLFIGEVIQETCAAILRVDLEQKHLVQPIAPELPKEMIQAIERVPIHAEAGCSGRAAHLNEPVFIIDVQRSSYCRDFEALIKKYKLRSCWSIPIVSSSGSVIGIITLYFKTKRRPDEYEHKLMERLASITGLALENRQANTRINESEHKFRLSFEASPIPKALVNKEGHLIEVNHAFTLLTGYTSLELMKMKLDTLIHEEEVQTCQDIIVSLAENEFDTFDYESRFLNKNNKVLSTLITASALRKKGEFMYSLLQIQDVSERKRALERETRLGKLLEDSLHEIYVFDGNHYQFIMVNRGGRENLGFDMSELNKRTPVDIIFEMNTREFNQLLEPLKEGHIEAITLNLQFRRKGGTLYDVEVSIQRFNLEGALQYVLMAKDITQNKILSEKLKYHASHDSLTGLVNRREFENRIKRVIRSTSRNDNVEHALCYLDLDQFKVINDTCGHIAGDELLRQISKILSKATRNRDTIARLGGDEFGILIEHCQFEQAIRICNEIRIAIEEYRFVWQGNRFVLGVSIGLTLINKETQTITRALTQADTACYAAKDAGRNRVHIYSPDDRELNRLRSEIQWVNRINEAIELDHFELFAQKIFPVGEKQKCNKNFIEILLRMREPDDRLSLPGAFMPAAERFQLASRIDRWVFLKTIEYFANNTHTLNELELCSINISGQTISDNDFRKWALNLIKTQNFPAEKLCFEITETAAIANMANALGFISEFSQSGCSFALDDFGSGLSSFAYLKNLPVDYLKIDGTFVRDILNDPVDYQMVHAIHNLGKIMGKKMIAEFVENITINKKLYDIGVDYAQGFALHEPEPLKHYTLAQV